MYIALPPSSAPLHHPRALLFDDDETGRHGTLGNWSSFIGIVTAIVGNVLIALALNVQRYAHIRLHRERKRVRERARQALKNAAKNGSNSSNGGNLRGYGSLDEERHDEEEDDDETAPLMRRSEESHWSDEEEEDEDGTLRKRDSSSANKEAAPSSYLKSPYWWLGQILITVGEMGNFLAYGFAPASIVSPLGVVALISNCVIAPIVFGERFRSRDAWGVLIAVAGAVTVVFSASSQETKLDPHAVWEHITSTGFEIYMGVTGALILGLMWLSPKYGNRTILIDLGLVGLFGGYTALSTKGVSSMLSSTLLGAFTTPVTYVLIVILLGTAIMQVRYVNKALQRFDSTQVIPIQFVSFTLCVIIGSAVLYRDFERTTLEQALRFIGGCFLTFFGVFLITSGRPPTDEDEDEDMLSDDENIEETLRLAEQDHPTPASPQQQRRRDSGGGGDTRSSRRSSRVSFMDAVNKPLATLAETGVPTPRSRASAPAEPTESAPLLRTPSRDYAAAPLSLLHHHPGIQHALSSESAVTISSATPVASEPVTPYLETPTLESTPPRASTSRTRSHHHFFSPSPFDSAVRGLVPSTLLVTDKRPPSSRRRLSRPSIRSSLYVPQDELDLEAAMAAGTMSAIERSRTVEEEIGGQAGSAGGNSSSSSNNKKGFRNRAKSLTHAVGDLFGAGGMKKRGSVGSEGGAAAVAPLTRNRDGDGEGEGSQGEQGNQSTATL